MTVIRNAGIGITLGIQDPVQLDRIYKEKDARILFGQPRTKIFFAPADDLVAVRLSKMLGTKTEREDVSASGQLSNREFPRPLIDAAELMRLEKEQKYICLTATETIKLDPIKSWIACQDQMNSPPPPRPVIKIDESYYETKEANSPPVWAAKIQASQVSEADKFYPELERNQWTSADIDRYEKAEQENFWDDFSRQVVATDNEIERKDIENE